VREVKKREDAVITCITFKRPFYFMVEENSQKKITADFQCFVCGAIFTSEKDRRQHLEKEMHSGAEKKDIDTVKGQTELSEMNKQAYESV
jgi:uncharacterized C2H2 Zn-finger protein